MTAEQRPRPRRVDKQITDPADLEALLASQPVGFIATAVDDQPYLIPNLFWFDAAARRLYFHTARQGRTRENIERNPRVCFSVAELGRLLPADTALEFNAEYASVIAFGRARFVDDPEEQRHGLQGLLDKHFPQLHPGRDYRPMTDDELERTAVFAIDIEAWSGKRERQPELPNDRRTP